jgi:hypothetical protein
MDKSEYRKKQDEAERKREEAAEQSSRQQMLAALERIAQQNQATENQARRADTFHRRVEKLTLRLEGRKFWLEIFETLGLWVAAGVGVAAIVVSTSDSREQRDVMQGQLSEMRSSSQQTNQLVGANARLAEAAAKQAEAAEKQATAMADSAKAARDNLIASERAWVGPRNAKIDGAIEIGKSVDISIEYANTGHEPAQNFFSSVEGFMETDQDEKSGSSLKKMMTFFESCQKSRNNIVGQVVFPTSGFSAYNLGAKLNPENVTQEFIDGKTTLIVQGCFLYESFSAFRHTYFCYFYNAKTTKPANLSICHIGDSAD